MASKVPKFGAWEGGENYTAYFDNARQIKNTGPMINPNDPQENPDAFPHNTTPSQGPPPQNKDGSQGQQFKVPQFGAWDDGNSVSYTVYFENARKTKKDLPPTNPNEPHMNRDGGEVAYTMSIENKKNGPTGEDEPSNARKTKNVGPVPQLNRDVVDGPPAQPPPAAARAKAEEQLTQGGVRSRFDQRGIKEEGQLRNTSQRSTASAAGSETPVKQGRQTPGGQTPLHSREGKLQARPVGRGSQTPDRGAAIPPFGLWNNDPTQAEGFTSAFTRAREERMAPSPYPHNQTHSSKPDEKKGCCFACFR